MISKEASARGGRAKTAAKMDATAKAQSARRQATQARRAALVVPAGFASATDFLRTVAEVAGHRLGGGLELANHVGVSNSTLSKWFRGSKIPEQANLNKIEEWWRAQLVGLPEPTLRVAVVPGGRSDAKAVVSLSRLPEAISERLRRTARRRNLTPIQYATQILDRALPRIEELDA